VLGHCEKHVLAIGSGGDATLRVMSWNVQGAVPPYGDKERIRNQVDFIKTTDSPEVLMLNEVTTRQRDFWRELLQNEMDYRMIVDTLDWAAELEESEIPPHHEFIHCNGNLIAVHDDCKAKSLTRKRPSIRNGPWEDSVLKDWSTNFPEKILNAELELPQASIDLWNVRTVPGNMYGEEKIKILENVYSRIVKAASEQCILAGDLNSPKAELDDGTTVPWGIDREPGIRERWIDAELNIFTGLAGNGILDVFRKVKGYGDVQGEDVSFQSKRFDHIFASESLSPEECHYDHNGLNCSDHAPLVAEFAL